MIEDVWLEPRHLRRPRARAEDQVVVVAASGDGGDPLGDVRRGVEVLVEVGAAGRPAAVVHRERDRVRDEGEPRLLAHLATVAERGDDRVDDRLEEAGVVEVQPELVQLWGVVASCLPDGRGGGFTLWATDEQWPAVEPFVNEVAAALV